MKATADICDQFGSKARVLQGLWQNYGSSDSFFGPVYTVRAPEDNSKVRDALDQAGYGRILVVDGLGSQKCALLGGNLAKLAAMNGWAGVVVFGCIRDSQEIRSEAIGVRALGSCPQKSTKLGRGDLGIELNLQDVLVRPGDYLFADGDGMVLLPVEEAKEILP